MIPAIGRVRASDRRVFGYGNVPWKLAFLSLCNGGTRLGRSICSPLFPGGLHVSGAAYSHVRHALCNARIFSVLCDARSDHAIGMCRKLVAVLSTFRCRLLEPAPTVAPPIRRDSDCSSARCFRFPHGLLNLYIYPLWRTKP